MEQEKVFWDWFVENKHSFEEILDNVKTLSQEKIDDAMNLFEKYLHQYNENIWFRMGSKNPFELIINAEGNINYFSVVEQLVSNAPEIENWKIIAFIQPTNLFSFHYKKDDYELSDKNIFFSYAEKLIGNDGYFLEVMFYVDDEKFIDDDGFKSSIIRIAESALGEYDFARIIGFINVVPKSEIYQEHKSGQLPIHKLSEISNEIKQKINY